MHPETEGVARGVVSLEQAPAAAGERSLFQVGEIRSDGAESRDGCFEACGRVVGHARDESVFPHGKVAEVPVEAVSWID